MKILDLFSWNIQSESSSLVMNELWVYICLKFKIYHLENLRFIISSCVKLQKCAQTFLSERLKDRQTDTTYQPCSPALGRRICFSQAHHLDIFPCFSSVGTELYESSPCRQ